MAAITSIATPEAPVHRDFSKYMPTDEDRLTIRKWKNSLKIFYGLALLLLVSFVAVQNRQTGMPHNAAASAANTIAAIDKTQVH